MKRCPKVGARVRYPGGPATGPCIGVVTKIYVSHAYDESKSDRWNALNSPALPEPLWHVALKPDVLPERWPYQGHDHFAPCVADLQPE